MIAFQVFQLAFLTSELHISLNMVHHPILKTEFCEVIPCYVRTDSWFYVSNDGHVKKCYLKFLPSSKIEFFFYKVYFFLYFVIWREIHSWLTCAQRRLICLGQTPKLVTHLYYANVELSSNGKSRFEVMNTRPCIHRRRNSSDICAYILPRFPAVSLILRSYRSWASNN